SGRHAPTACRCASRKCLIGKERTAMARKVLFAPRLCAMGFSMESFQTSADVLFLLLGAIMVLAMHAGFAFLEVGTVRKKNQVNALVKILVDFSVSAIAYFFVGY